MSTNQKARVLEANLVNVVLNARPTVADAGNTLTRLKSVTPKSISRMSRDNIMQFPVNMSADVPSDAQLIITKGLERIFASFITLCLQNQLNVRSDEYHTVSDVLKTIHTNDDIPNLFRYAIDISDAGESTQVQIPKSEMDALWFSVTESLNMGSLNDLYVPNKASINKLDRVLHRTAIEASDRVDFKSEMYGNPDGRKPGKAYTEIARDKTNAYEPTIIRAPMVVDNDQRSIQFGVKGMTRLFNPAYIVSELSRSVQSHTLAFKIIKWSRGELRFFRDVVLALKDSREDAQRMKTNGALFAPAFNRRKAAAKTFLGSHENIAPITTWVITDREVEEVRAETGIDIMDNNVALNLMRSNYLLALMVYNTQTKTLSTMLDGRDQDMFFRETTLRGLSANIKSDSDISTEDIVRMIGARR